MKTVTWQQSAVAITRARWLARGVMVLLAALAVRALLVPDASVFAITPHGRIPLVTAASPPWTVPRVSRWTAVTLSKIFSFNFVNAHRHLAAMRRDFSPSGWTGIQGALLSSKMTKTVIGQRLAVTLIVTAPPRVVHIDRMMGRIWWTIQAPVLLVYQGTTAPRATHYLVQVVVGSESTVTSPQGLSINQIMFASPDEIAQ